MAEAAQPASPSATTRRTTVDDASVGLSVQQFLDDWHYRIMSSSLGKKWPRKTVVLAALDVLAFNGVDLPAEERPAAADTEESQLIDLIVERMPEALKENFDHLAMLLQTVVTTVTRILNCLEDKDGKAVQEVMEETDSSVLGQQVLKQAVVHASTEIADLYRYQRTWGQSMEKRLDRLTRASELAEHANQQLMAVEAQLNSFGREQNEKNKKVLLGMADGNDKSLLHTTFSNWLGVMMKHKAEAGIRAKFEKEIEDMEQQLRNYKDRQLKGVRNVLLRKCGDEDTTLIQVAFTCWMDEIRDIKAQGDNAAAIKALEEKLEQTKGDQKDNTKKVLARMQGGREDTLISMCLTAWTQFSAEYKKNKEFEDQVKQQEAQLRDHMAKKKDEAKSVLDRMSGATNTGLLASVISNWWQHLVDEKKLREREMALDGVNGRFQGLADRQTGNARSVQNRVNEQIKANLLLQCFGGWQIESKVNHIDKYYNAKMDSKRRQLQGVQTIFKSFAKQLDEGLANVDGGDSSGRTRPTKSKSGGLKESVSGGMKESVSLPDIHARPIPA